MLDSFATLAKRAVGIPEPTKFEFTDSDGSKAEIVLDCTKVIETSLNSQLTKFPVEAGFSITDHSISAPITLKISGEITESPLTVTAIVQNLAKAGTTAGLNALGVSNGFATAAAGAGISLRLGSASDFISGNTVYGDQTVMKALGKRESLDVNYPKRMQVALSQLCEYKMNIKVSTYFNKSTYKDMVIKSASFSQNPKNPDNLNFNLVLQQIRTVQIEKSKIDIPKKTEGNVVDPSGSSAAKKVKKGTNKANDGTIAGKLVGAEDPSGEVTSKFDPSNIQGG